RRHRGSKPHTPMEARVNPKVLLFAVAAAAVLAGGCTKEEPVKASAPPASVNVPAAGNTAPTPQAGASASGGAVQTLPDFAAIVDANKGAVVNITATKVVSPRAQSPFGGGGGGDDEDNPLNEFLRRFQGPMPRMPMQGMGSGFIVHSDGVVLTN